VRASHVRSQLGDYPGKVDDRVARRSAFEQNPTEGVRVAPVRVILSDRATVAASDDFPTS